MKWHGKNAKKVHSHVLLEKNYGVNWMKWYHKVNPHNWTTYQIIMRESKDWCNQAYGQAHNPIHRKQMGSGCYGAHVPNMLFLCWEYLFHSLHGNYHAIVGWMNDDRPHSQGSHIVFAAFNYQNTNFEKESWPAKNRISFHQKSQHLQKMRHHNQCN